MVELGRDGLKQYEKAKEDMFLQVCISLFVCKIVKKL